jgi:hypothetical protein
MTVTITHNKTNTLTDWTQGDLDTVIGGGAAPLPPSGTLISDVVLPSDWNDDHVINGLATVGETGEFIDLVDVPSAYTGQASKFVKVKATEDGLEFVAGSGGATAWGDITGTLSNQTDLQTALDGKVDENAAITGATKTKVTYDAKGLVTAGADATTADIADSTDKRYVTDAQLVVIGNTSGTNTGDVTVSDSAEIDLTLTGQQISASIVSGSIDETKLDASVNASLDLADTALQAEVDTLQTVTNRGATSTNTVTLSPSGNNKALVANGSGSGAAIDITHSGSGVKLNIGATGSGDAIRFDTDKFVVNDDGDISSSLFTASRALATNASKEIVTTAVTDTELGYISGLTSSAQTQLNGKQPLATVLTNTTASFTTALETKLNGIEAGADVTDATNVAAAGAVMTSSLGTGVAASLAVNLGAANTIATVNAGGTALNYLYAINQNIQTVDSPTFAGVTLSAAALPSTNDAAALGSASLSWSDLFLASGGVINWNNGSVTLAEASGSLQLNKNLTLQQTEDTVWNESFTTGVFSGISIKNDSTTVGSASGIVFWNRTTSVASGGIMQVLAGANDADTYYSVEGGSHNFCGITPSTATTVEINGALTISGALSISKAVRETIYDNGNSGTSKAINLDNGNLQKVTITGNVAITQTTPAATGRYTLIVTIDGSPRTYSLSGLKWAGGVDPTYSTAAGSVDIFSILYDGTNYYASAGIAFAT